MNRQALVCLAFAKLARFLLLSFRLKSAMFSRAATFRKRPKTDRGMRRFHQREFRFAQAKIDRNSARETRMAVQMPPP